MRGLAFGADGAPRTAVPTGILGDETLMDSLNPNRRRWRRFAAVLAIAGLAAALPVAASAQWFGQRFGQPSRPPPQGNFFQFPFFGDQNDQFNRPPAPIESTKAPPPRKQETPPTSTIVVIGDSLADWLAYGLEENYADSPEIGVVRKIRPVSGLVRYEPRSDATDWAQAVKDILAPEKPVAIVVMLGLNDRLPLRERAAAHPGAQGAQPPAQSTPPGQEGKAAPPAAAPAQEGETPIAANEAPPGPGGAYEFRSDKWEELYSKRIDDMIAAVKAKGVPVLWVGLPSIRGPRSTSDMSYLDELYRERAEKAGIVYVDIWDGFVDDQGRYTTQGPDFEGQIRRLRTGDGVHFTKIGAVKLAHFLDHDLGRVLSSHAVPVALPGPEETAPKPNIGPRPAVGPVLPLTPSAGDGRGESNDLAGAGPRPTPVTADPVAAQVLSRGDPLAAPPGRADDFAWPRPGTDANGTPDSTPDPAALIPAAPPKPAGRADGKKPTAGKNESRTETKTDAKTETKIDAKTDTKTEAKGKTLSESPPGRAKKSPSAALDGAPQASPASAGPAAANAGQR